MPAGLPEQFWRFDLGFLRWYWHERLPRRLLLRRRPRADLERAATPPLPADRLRRPRGVRHVPRLRPDHALPQRRRQPRLPLGQQLLLQGRGPRQHDDSAVRRGATSGGPRRPLSARSTPAGMRASTRTIRTTSSTRGRTVAVHRAPACTTAASFGDYGIEVDEPNSVSPPHTHMLADIPNEFGQGQAGRDDDLPDAAARPCSTPAPSTSAPARTGPHCHVVLQPLDHLSGEQPGDEITNLVGARAHRGWPRSSPAEARSRARRRRQRRLTAPTARPAAPDERGTAVADLRRRQHALPRRRPRPASGRRSAASGRSTAVRCSSSRPSSATAASSRRLRRPALLDRSRDRPRALALHSHRCGWSSPALGRPPPLRHLHRRLGCTPLSRRRDRRLLARDRTIALAADNRPLASRRRSSRAAPSTSPTSTATSTPSPPAPGAALELRQRRADQSLAFARLRTDLHRQLRRRVRRARRAHAASLIWRSGGLRQLLLDRHGHAATASTSARSTATSTRSPPEAEPVLWSFGTGSYVYASPAVWRGLVLVGSYDHAFYAINGATGSLALGLHARRADLGRRLRRRRVRLSLDLGPQDVRARRRSGRLRRAVAGRRLLPRRRRQRPPLPRRTRPDLRTRARREVPLGHDER